VISIIIPVLNEKIKIQRLLIELAKLQGDKEILIIDGGSSDGTQALASKYGKVISSEKGRAKQMNKGAKESNGDILWFVHADSKVSSNSIEEIKAAIDEGYIGGGFSLEFYDYESIFLKYISITSNIRANHFGVFYGDQGIFVKSQLFHKLGGFLSQDLMEDLELSLLLRKAGKLKLIDSPIGTSARRFKLNGMIKTHLLMHKIRFLYFLGVPTNKLVKMYGEVRK